MTFFEEIEKLCKDKNIKYIDALLLFSEEKQLEIEIVADQVKENPLLKSKIQYEAEDLNFLKRSARLPI